uniref:Hpc2-related domain-containing protein n=1 Tax=Panagrolaimus superbus TaxID=310955 RepID=A0A914Z2S8_9BILA
MFKKKEEKKQANVFIEIDLDRRRGKRYPEYNYMDLVNDQKRKMNTYCDDDDSRYVDPDAAEIVKRLEAKYGNKKSKKTKYHIDDFIDKSQGYDLDDPFVDDTDIYDEYLPSTMSTSKGGFYINRGKLDFKNVVNEDDFSDEEKKRAPAIPNERNNQQRTSTLLNERNNHHRQERAPPIPIEKINHQRAPAIPIDRSNHQRAPPIPTEKINPQRPHERAPAIPNLARTHATTNVTKEKSPAQRGK